MNSQDDTQRRWTTASEKARAIEGYVPFPDDRASAYVEAGYWANKRIHDVVDEHAANDGRSTAVIDHRTALTYSELATESRHLARGLRAEFGFERLDRIVFQVPNRSEFLTALVACSRIGVVPVMALPRHRHQEVEHVATTTGSNAIVTVASGDEFNFLEMGDRIDAFEHRIAIRDDNTSLPKGWHAFDEVRSVDGDEDLGRDDTITDDVNPCDPAFFLLSGGTTGMPKSIPRTHNDHLFQWRTFADVMTLEPAWTGVASVPVAHNASLAAIIGPALWIGATVALEPKLKPESLMAVIDRVEGNWSLAMTAQLMDIIDHPNRGEYDLSSLEVLISGGQKVPPQLAYDVEAELGVDFVNLFGMAEGPLIGTRPGDDIAQKAHTVGYPLAPAADEIRLVDTERRDRIVDQGEKGELAARGPGYIPGYFRNDEENDAQFDEDGWFYTGDVLKQREDGYYEVHGRLKEMIIRGGENIHTPGVENELVEHPRIANAVLVGKPDDRLGERPYAFVELTKGTTKDLSVEELSSWLDERGVAVFKHPEYVEVIDELPRTEVEKLDKQTLRERVQEYT